MAMKTLVLGMGNPILSDDGVGLRIAAELEGRVDRQEVTVAETSLAGLGLLDLLTGYDRAIVIDAIQTVGGEAGQVYRFTPEALQVTRHAGTTHDVDFATALELGKVLGLDMPQQIIIYAVEVRDVSSFSEECSPEVKRAIPACVEMVIEELDGDANTQLI